MYFSQATKQNLAGGCDRGYDADDEGDELPGRGEGIDAGDAVLEDGDFDEGDEAADCGEGR